MTRLRYAADLVFGRDDYLPVWPLYGFIGCGCVAVAYLRLRRA